MIPLQKKFILINNKLSKFALDHFLIGIIVFLINFGIIVENTKFSPLFKIIWKTINHDNYIIY